MARGYAWGSMDNTEPPDDDDDGMETLVEEGFDLGCDDGPDEDADERAANAYHAELDARATQ